MKRVLCVVMVLLLGVVMCGCMAPKEPEEPKSDSDVTREMKRKIVGYAQYALEKEIPGAKYSLYDDDYTVVRTMDRYKIEFKLDGGQRVTEILEWDYKEDEYYDVKYLQVGAYTYIDNRY